MRWPFLLIFLLLFTSHSRAGEKTVAPESIKGAITVSAEEVIKLIMSNPELVLIDARKEREYVKGHIEGAFNMLNTEMTEEKLQALVPKKEAAIVFYCNGPACRRSSDAVIKALSWDYTNVFWFRGGWKEWQDKWLPVVSGE